MELHYKDTHLLCMYESIIEVSYSTKFKFHVHVFKLLFQDSDINSILSFTNHRSNVKILNEVK